MRARLFCMCAGWLLIVPGGVSLFQSLDGQRTARIEWQRSAAGVVKAEPAAASAGKPSPAGMAKPFQLLFPRLKVERYVLPKYTTANLKRGPAWISSSALPGDVGNCVIAAHRDTHFRFLRRIRRGDEIIVVRNRERHHYRVESVFVVEPGNRDLLAGTAARQLTLVTCFPFTFIGRAPQRYVVRAIASNPDSGVNKTTSE